MKRNTFILIIKLLAFVKEFIPSILIAVFNGTLGFLLAMNISIFGALAILKYLNFPISLSYTQLFIIILISGAMRGGVRYIEQYFNHLLAFKLLAILREKIFAILRKLSPSKLDDKNKGEILSILQSDIETLEIFYAHTITPFAIALLTSSITALFLGIYIHWSMGVFALFAYFLIGIVIPYFFFCSNNLAGKLYRQKLSNSQELYLQSIFGSYEIISQNKQQEQIQTILSTTQALNSLNHTLEEKNTFFKNLCNTSIILLNLCIIILGAYLAETSQIVSVLNILGFVTLTSSFGSVIALSNLPHNLAMSFASGNRILDLLEEKPLVCEGEEELKFETLQVKNLSFEYKNKEILKNINLEIKKGEIVGIYGKSGSGKTTILKLLMHFYNPSGGEILYNGLPIDFFSHQSLYHNINLFSQETYLFSTTIKENLKIANPNATEQELIKATQEANIYELISSLPQQFDTQITDMQDNLSSGEKQRIGLARVFLRKPKLLLLDEATANIDALNESFILKSLKAHARSMGILIISHRPSTLSICDRIYHLSKGKLEENNPL